MGDYMTLRDHVSRTGREERAALILQDRALQELERHGYVAHPQVTEWPAGIMLRHPVAPDLLVCDDGRIELPSGQSIKHMPLQSPPARKKIRWGRTLMIATLLFVSALLGLILMVLIVG